MSVLDSIIAGVREDLEARRTRVSEARLHDLIAQRDPALPVLPVSDFSLICEVKRASPSKGALADIADPGKQARAYERGGAHAISVLTEQRRFGGSLADLDAVRSAVNIPVLRKDFMVDEYQFLEARAHGADIVLLIVAALSDAQLTGFTSLSTELGMSVLVETHTPQELERVRDLPAQLLGVNTRNLKDLSVDISRFSEVARHSPAGAVLVAESGVTGASDVADYASHGASLALVGEALVRSGDPAGAVEEFITAGRAAKRKGHHDGSAFGGDRTVLR